MSAGLLYVAACLRHLKMLMTPQIATYQRNGVRESCTLFGIPRSVPDGDCLLLEQASRQ